MTVRVVRMKNTFGYSFVAALLALWLIPRPGVAQVPLHDPANLEVLKTHSGKAKLNDAELKAVREAMLKINNEARQNPNYRKAKNLKNDLTLPANLEPLVLDDFLNNAAQMQAEVRAGLRRLPAGTQPPGLMASGWSTELASFPENWQSSEQTYRPTWNLGGSPVDSVGYGVAKNPQNGQWAAVALWADRGGAAAKDSGLHTPELIATLAKLSDQQTLSADQLKTVRETMLKLNNEARANPDYRKKSGSTQDLNLPSNLSPLVLDDAANKAAQEQADYQARINTMTHDNRNYSDFSARLAASGATGGLEACGVSSNLQDFPIGWMKSDTHYRPTWNIVDPVNRVGYGVARRGDRWYATAIWRQVDEKAKAETVEQIAPATAQQPDPFAIKPADAQATDVKSADAKSAEAKPAAAEVAIPPGLKTVGGQQPTGITYSEPIVNGKPDPFGERQASLRKGGILYKGQTMPAQNGGDHRLIITNGGAVAVVDGNGDIQWSAGRGGTHVEYQAGDGNFCLYDDGKNWKWGSQTYGPKLVNGEVRINKDGVLEQLDDSGKVVWKSK